MGRALEVRLCKTQSWKSQALQWAGENGQGRTVKGLVCLAEEITFHPVNRCLRNIIQHIQICPIICLSFSLFF